MTGHAQAGFFFCLALWLCWFVWLGWEDFAHRRNLGRFRLRIHVNGTRGKSGVTRLIAAGLRAGGGRVFAKVTGTDAKFIYPDGTERGIPRRGPANIREYLRTAKEAVSCGADVLVSECMALRPELQKFCEYRLMKSHIGVITNIRQDHEEIMGADLVSIAASLGRTIPEKGLLVTTAEALALVNASKDADKKNDEVRAVLSQEVAAEELKEFPFEVEADNLAIALAVCELAGVDRQLALAGMRQSMPDVGNLTVSQVQVKNRTIKIINAMAANDPDSSRILWNRYVGKETAAGVLLHARPDRRLRTQSLCSLLVTLHTGPFYLTGDTDFACKCLSKLGINKKSIVCIPEPAMKIVLDCVSEMMDSKAGILFAAGNMKGFVN